MVPKICGDEHTDLRILRGPTQPLIMLESTTDCRHAEAFAPALQPFVGGLRKSAICGTTNDCLSFENDNKQYNTTTRSSVQTKNKTHTASVHLSTLLPKTLKLYSFQAAAKALKKLLKKEKKKKAAEAAEAAATPSETPAPGRPRTRSMDLAEASSGRPRTRSMDLADGTVSSPGASSKADKKKTKKKKKRKAEDSEEAAPKKAKTASGAAVAAAEPTGEEAAVAAAAAPPLSAEEFCATHKILVKSDDGEFSVPVPMASFESTPFGGPIRGALKAAGYPAPTPTQAQ